MAHKSLVGGTAYEIVSGKTLINGTSYSISKGKTLISGTAYEVAFLLKITLFTTDTSIQGVTCTVSIGDETYTLSQVASAENQEIILSLPAGTEIVCTARQQSNLTGGVWVNGSRVSSTSYTYTVTKDASIEMVDDSHPIYGDMSQIDIVE